MVYEYVYLGADGSNLDSPLRPPSCSYESLALAQEALSQRQSDYKDTSGFDLEEIRILDLKQYRNSYLSGASYFLLLIPVIGWIALACLRCYYVSAHRSAERVMERKRSDSDLSLDDKIQVVSFAIMVSGPHAWQYRLERARLYLLNKDFKAAVADLAVASKERGKPWHQEFVDMEKQGKLISFKAASCVGHLRDVMQIDYHDGVEALLNAVAFAGNGQYVEAYDAYNEVAYYEKDLSSCRKHQCSLVTKMRENPLALWKRGREIIKAEPYHSK